MMTLSLQEVLIVGASSDQVKFSELTLDMFRMLQTLEREPQEDLTHMYDASPGPGRLPSMVSSKIGTLLTLVCLGVTYPCVKSMAAKCPNLD